ncbi:HTH_Tnp_Tc3_2 domain-containing protein [Trichonephila clavipes]|uniref:HTH_Tnp_Tc3_2 domain-containing protein n=1 Tax=Trichonephila clavipes TaxID=2585209 RepID=A0A8X6WF66_TRICX|nr:HTH_Tnp_Tc3_2 domain-containing protein [Trichonephila clavipes]
MPSCHSVHDLELAVQDLWAHLLQDNIRCLINSMPDRMAACIAAGGGPTRIATACKLCNAAHHLCASEGACNNCIYSACCGCSELVVGIASTGKLPDLDAFDRRQFVGARRMGYSISENVRQLGLARLTVSRVYQEYMDDGPKASDRANYKRQLDLTVRYERRFRRIVRSQGNQTLAQITTQLNDGTVSKGTQQRSLPRMGFGSRRPMRVPLLNARNRGARLAWARKHKEWSMEDWKRVAWSDESRFRLLNAYGRLRK